MKKIIEGFKFGSAHWYSESGEPRHDADLRTARKEKLFPSVTTILSLLDKPALKIWLQQQAILAALTLPKDDIESLDEYAKRVVEDAQEVSRKACDYGTLVHKYIEDKISGIEALLENKLIQDGIDKHVLTLVGKGTPEKRSVNIKEGYAGTIDFLGSFAGINSVVDFKTQNTKQGKIVFYPEWIYQLAAYALAENCTACVSVAISTSEPGLVKIKKWSDEEIEHAQKVFLKTKELFYLIKKL